MPPVMVTLSPSPSRVAELEDDQFDPATFEAELIADVDDAASSHKCSCASSDDNPY